MYHLHIKSDGGRVQIHTADGMPLIRKRYTMTQATDAGKWELKNEAGAVVSTMNRATKERAIERAIHFIANDRGEAVIAAPPVRRVRRPNPVTWDTPQAAAMFTGSPVAPPIDRLSESRAEYEARRTRERMQNYPAPPTSGTWND